MEMKQVSDNCFAVLIEKNRVCDANSGLINRGGGVVIDTQSDLAHARQMIELFSKVWPAMPNCVINTHEDGDHVWGNQLFEGAEIIAHGGGPYCLDSLMGGISSEFIVKLFMKHQAASANG